MPGAVDLPDPGLIGFALRYAKLPAVLRHLGAKEALKTSPLPPSFKPRYGYEVGGIWRQERSP